MELIRRKFKALSDAISAPYVQECAHNVKPKYKLVVKNVETQITTHKKICSKCAQSDLDNNKVFVSLY